MNSKDFAEFILKKAKMPLSSEEIWAYAKDYKLDSKSSLKGKTPWRTIDSQIYVDIDKHGEKSNFYVAAKNPTRFFLHGVPEPKKNNRLHFERVKI